MAAPGAAKPEEALGRRERLMVVLPTLALGGIRTHTLVLLNGAAQRQHNVLVVTVQDEAPALPPSDHVEVRRIAAWDAEGLDRVAAWSRDCGGVVVAASPSTVALLPRLDGQRAVLAVHGQAETVSAWLGPRLPVLQVLLQGASAFNVVTPGAAYRAPTADMLGIAVDRVSAFRNSCLSPPAVPPEHFEPVTALTVVARLALDKAYLVDAAISLARVLEVPLRVVGTGSGAEALRDRLATAGVEHEVDEDGDVLAAIDTADALVGSGIVALEGLTRGKRVVVAAEGGRLVGVVDEHTFADLQAGNFEGVGLPSLGAEEVAEALRSTTPQQIAAVQGLLRSRTQPLHTYGDVLASLGPVRVEGGQAEVARVALDSIDRLDQYWRTWAEQLDEDRSAWRRVAQDAVGTHQALDAVVETLQNTVREQRADLVAATHRYEAGLNGLHARIGGLETELAALLSILDKAASDERRIAELQTSLHAVEAHRDALLTSTSWRVTAPIRVVGDLRRRGDQVARLRKVATAPRLRKAAQLLIAGDVQGVVRRAHMLLGGQVAAAEPTVSAVQVRRQVPWPSEEPLVSVIVPCFNYGEYVRQAVDSVLAQTLARVEVIVIEAGSTDGTTVDAVRRLERELGDRVRVHYREGRHLLGDNRNYGARHARGKYLCSLDADDMLHPVFLEMAVYLLEAHGYDIVSTALQCFGGTDDFVGTIEYPTLDDMLEGNYIYAPGLYRKDAWAEAGGYHDTGLGAELIYEDWRFWQRLLALGARAVNIVGQPLFYYRRNNDGGSQSSHPDVPDITSQRRAVAAFNADVITPAALERSRQLAQTDVVMERPLLNLLPSTDVRSGLVTTVLVGLPFMLVGGVERLASGLMAAFPSGSYRFVVVTTVATDPAYGESTAWFEAITPEVYQLPKLLPHSRWSQFLDYLILAKDVDVVWLLGSEFLYDELPRLRRAHPRLRVVDNLFNTEGHTRNNRLRRQDIDLTLVENEEVATHLLSSGEAPARVKRTGSGIDTARYAPTTTTRPNGPLRIGYVGRLSVEKNPMAVPAIAQALPEASSIHFVIAGGGPLEQDLRREIERRGVGSRVDYIGVVQDVRALLAELDVLILPSLLDGSPQVVLEAQASGVPVLASDVGGLRQLVVDGVTGVLCRAGDDAGFARALVALAADRAKLETMRQRAREHAERNLSMDALVQCYESAFAQVLGSRQP